MKQIVITISSYYLDRLDIVAENLRKEGVTITRLYEFGVIIGYAEEETINQSVITKRLSLYRTRKRQPIPPPDADIQSLPPE